MQKTRKDCPAWQYFAAERCCLGREAVVGGGEATLTDSARRACKESSRVEAEIQAASPRRFWWENSQNRMMAPCMLLNGLVLFSKLTYSKTDVLCIEFYMF